MKKKERKNTALKAELSEMMIAAGKFLFFSATKTFVFIFISHMFNVAVEHIYLSIYVCIFHITLAGFNGEIV